MEQRGGEERWTWGGPVYLVSENFISRKLFPVLKDDVTIVHSSDTCRNKFERAL